MKKELIKLPPGITVKKESWVGISYIYKGQVIAQHPKDTNAMRSHLWNAYRNKRGKLGILMKGD